MVLWVLSVSALFLLLSTVGKDFNTRSQVSQDIPLQNAATENLILSIEEDNHHHNIFQLGDASLIDDRTLAIPNVYLHLSSLLAPVRFAVVWAFSTCKNPHPNHTKPAHTNALIPGEIASLKPTLQAYQSQYHLKPTHAESRPAIFLRFVLVAQLSPPIL